MRSGGDGNVDEWPPLRALRFSDERHASLVREAVSLARIAGDARADNILPSRLATAIAGHDVIEIQGVARENNAAVLAGVRITLEDIVAREFHLFLRQALKHQQHDDSRNPDFHRNGLHHLAIRVVIGKILPTREVVRHKFVAGSRGDDLGVALIKEGESAFGAAGVDRLPEPIQNQYRCFEGRLHG